MTKTATPPNTQEAAFLCEALVAEVGGMADALKNIAAKVSSCSSAEMANIAEALTVLTALSPGQQEKDPRVSEALRIAHSGRILLDVAQSAMAESTLLRDKVSSLERELGLAVKMASVDKLTGLLTRRGGEPLIADLFAEGVTHCVAVLDIDHFKSVNDTYGHAAGDQALSLFAHTVRGSIRDTDLFLRWGGEEFAIVFANTSMRGGVMAAEAIRVNLARTPLFTEGGRLTLTCSIGVAERSSKVATFDQLFEKADQAMYLAKKDGRNCVRVAR